LQGQGPNGSEGWKAGIADEAFFGVSFGDNLRQT
jgi:hypothetical protein